MSVHMKHSQRRKHNCVALSTAMFNAAAPHQILVLLISSGPLSFSEDFRVVRDLEQNLLMMTSNFVIINEQDLFSRFIYLFIYIEAFYSLLLWWLRCNLCFHFSLIELILAT
ncbi:hypothetical protein MtrunA17_Chr1g0161311 [Medicago truncatula]|uniref:Transmembrane protein, putative n=1 Tax=Medicago truncatula TaxID=3880 RepID=A0A072VR56_MEDTR|nr:transmembrane protein, putative [Medicago truncatula]RHN78052.1 hypothetical protein MtrunA17_Chr1g0161311 [Medicago truncatula]